MISLSHANDGYFENSNKTKTLHNISDSLIIETISFNSETKTFQINFSQNISKRTAVSYGIEISDDRGNFIIQPTKQDAFLLFSETEQSRELVIPDGLKDGYYIFKIKGAFVGNEIEEHFEKGIYFMIKNLEAKELSIEEFYKYSSMSMEYINPTDGKGEKQ